MKTSIQTRLINRTLIIGIIAGSFLSAAYETRSQTEIPPRQIDAPARTDAQIARDILMAMMHDDVNNALTFRNIRFPTVNGQVTVIGRVRTEKQRIKLIAIASSVVGAENVHDQLEVR